MELINPLPSFWIKFKDATNHPHNGTEYIPFNKAQVKEATNRMDAVREMLFKIYPEPMGVDIGWHHTIGRG